MSDRQRIELVIPNRSRTLAGHRVARVLPFSKRRAVGPFVFLDHFGPVEVPPGQRMDVLPHPHIGLSTLTYLFAGESVHRDSLGVVQTIRPGEVNWMTAGRGIVHSERSPVPAKGGLSHGLQFWVALPKAKEQGEPSFQHYAATSLPIHQAPGVRGKVIAGQAFGLRSPVEVSSPLSFLELHLEDGAELALPTESEERALYLLSGTIEAAEGPYGPGQLLVLTPGPGTIKAQGPTHLVLFGGAPLDGPRHLYWNFVASDPALLEAAKQAWREDRFPKIPGDDQERVPLPE